MFGFLCSVICTCLLHITNTTYFEMENNQEDGNSLSKSAKRRLKQKKRSENIRCGRSVVQMRDGLLIPHGLGYCYFCKETVDLTLILNHYEECVRKKQLSSVPRVDIVQEQRKRKPNETTNQPAKKGKCGHSCSWKNCGKNSSAKQVANVVIGTESSVYCIVDHLKKASSQTLSSIFKRRIHIVELGPGSAKKKTCSSCDAPDLCT